MAESGDEVEELKISLFQFGEEEPNGDLILVAAQKCIDRGKCRELADICTRAENKNALEFVGWQLIALLSQPIVAGNDMVLVEECTRLLRFIAETCSPKEVCIGALEQLESQASCEKFVALLGTLKIAIQRLGQKKSKYVGMVLPSVTQHIRQIHLAEETNDVELSGTRRTTDITHAVMSHVLLFLSPLVQEACSSSHICSFQKDIIYCLIQLLDSPLVFLDTTRDPTEMGSAEDKEEPSIQRSRQPSEASPYRHYAQVIMEYLHICNCSFIYLMEYMSKHSRFYTGAEMSKDHKEEMPEKEIFPAMGLSCFAYLLLVENIEEAHFPSVFSHEYLLTVNMKSIVCLLKRTHLLPSTISSERLAYMLTECHAIYKGLTLLDLLSRRVNDRSIKLSGNMFADAVDVAKGLVNVMIMCSSKKLVEEQRWRFRTSENNTKLDKRLMGVQLFPEFFQKLHARGRYGLLYSILTDCTHSGVAGLLIYLLKEQINQAFSWSSDEPWFHGSRFMSIFQLIFKPLSAMKAERDVVQETDRIMAALNCLRFILLRDESDKTTVWKNFASVERDFVEPLRETIKVTRIQYQAELISKRDEMAGKKGKEEKESIEFRINSPDGKVLGMMPLPEQCEALQSGLHSLDMMESVLTRISEIAHCRSKGRN